MSYYELYCIIIDINVVFNYSLYQPGMEVYYVKKSSKIFSVLTCFFITFSGLTLAGKSKVSATPDSYTRLGGATRYLTSIAISKDGWSQSSDYIVLASGENYADALCAAPLAKLYNAPILLTPHDSLKNSDQNNSLEAEIQRLSPTYAFIIGGTGAVSDNIINELQELGISKDNCERIYGQDRYGTSLEVAKKILKVRGSISSAAVASGENFPDALSIASIAAANSMPILLTRKSSIDSDIEAFINGASLDTTYIIGGTGVISDSTVNNLTNKKRLSGADRYQTNLAVINEFIQNNSALLNNIYVTTSTGFADALSGAADAAKDNAPVLLVSNNNYSNFQDTIDMIHSNLRNISAVKVLGGTGVVSDALSYKLVNPDRIVLGYSTYWSSYDTKSLITMQNYPSAIDEVGTFTFVSDSTGNISNAYPTPTAQLSCAKSSGMKALALVTDDFDNSVSHPLLSNATYRKNFINNIIAIIQTNGYSGVNIDFEGMKAWDRNNFSTFMQELYTALHPLNYLVTVDVIAKTYDSPSDNWTGPYDYAQLGKYTDQVAIMTYDYSWTVPGSIAPIYWVQNVVDYAAAVIPRNKILLGLEAYGKDWCEQTNPDGSLYYTTNVYGVAGTINLASQYGARIILDDYSKSEHFDYTDSSGRKHHAWFEDGTSVAYKLNLVNNEDLGGVAIWDLAYPDANYMNQIKTILKK